MVSQRGQLRLSCHLYDDSLPHSLKYIAGIKGFFDRDINMLIHVFISSMMANVKSFSNLLNVW